MCNICTNQKIYILYIGFFSSKTRVPFRSPQILLVQDPHWAAPRLLQLPDNYNIIFQYYHRKACSACQKVPKDPALCLVCGTFVCLKGQCSKQQGICECVLVRGPTTAATAIRGLWPGNNSILTEKGRLISVSIYIYTV